METHRSQAKYVRNGKSEGWKPGMNKSETRCVRRQAKLSQRVLAKNKEVRLERVKHRVSKS